MKDFQVQVQVQDSAKGDSQPQNPVLVEKVEQSIQTSDNNIAIELPENFQQNRNTVGLSKINELISENRPIQLISAPLDEINEPVQEKQSRTMNLVCVSDSKPIDQKPTNEELLQNNLSPIYKDKSINQFPLSEKNWSKDIFDDIDKLLQKSIYKTMNNLSVASPMDISDVKNDISL